MPTDEGLGERVSRDGKIGECDECGNPSYLALSRNGFRCSDCLTPTDLADVLALQHRNITPPEQTPCR